MSKVVCGRCRHEHPVGARVCEACGSKLYNLEIRRAMGYNPLEWLSGTAVGQMAPFFLVVLFLLGALALHPSPGAWRVLLLNFGLVGLVTLGVTFPLLKGQYDFSAGTVAALAACCAALVSPYGYGAAFAAAIIVGALVGLLNGYVVGATRIPSAMVTLITGTMALQTTLYLTTRASLQVTDPLLTSLADTNVVGIPVILGLFILALVLARVLFNQPIFTPVGGAHSHVHAADLASPRALLMSFLVSGLGAGLAGLLIAASGMTMVGGGSQMVWMLTPLAAALIGGGSVAAGTGNLRTATIGAAAIALVNWLCTQIHMPIAGPIVETPFLVIGLLADRWKNMTYYMIMQARQGNLLALPDDMQLPMVVRLWRKTPWYARVAGGLALVACLGAIYMYVCFYAVGRVPEGTALVLRLQGTVTATRYATSVAGPIAEKDKLFPGDMVTTGWDGRAALRLADGSEVRVFPNSEMYIRELATKANGATVTSLHVPVGALFAKVRKLVSRDSSFQVESPMLTLGVRGTSFQMVVDQRRRGNVAVGEGAVEVKRELKKADALTGFLRSYEDSRTVDAGKIAESGDETIVRKLDNTEAVALSATEKSLALDSRQSRVAALKTGSYRGLWVFVVLGYFIFILLLKPAPYVYPPDLIRQRADDFLVKHKSTPQDSPRAAALAQMAVRAGDLETARKAVQSIIDHDPGSEYGQWATRYWMQLEAERRRQSKSG